jgi:S-adenosyl methyltransferase
VDTRQASVPPLPAVDPDQPSPARIYDFWLGGKNNFEVDREVGMRAIAEMPTLRAAVHANRYFLRRVVKHLVQDCGVTQFLDLGSGIPTVGNVHEVAQQADPDARVVYVDKDPVAVALGRQLLADNGQATQIIADLRDPQAVLHDEQTRELLDLDKPVAVLMIAVLHFVPDTENPRAVVRSYRDALAAGSYLALSHAAPDRTNAHAQASMEQRYVSAVRVPFVHRTPDQMVSFLDGWSVQNPGIQLVDRWRPDNAPRADAQILPTYGLLARLNE